MKKSFVLVMLSLVLLTQRMQSAELSAVLVYDQNLPEISFAANDLKGSLQQKGFVVSTAPLAQLGAQTAPVQVVITTQLTSLPGQPAVAGLQKEGYGIRRIVNGTITRWWAIGNETAGAMYAGLDLTDSVKIDGSLSNVTDKLQNPRLTTRGIKFNIPLDVRTPSYADDSTAAHENILEVWSMPYWQRFLDQMARNRLNSLGLWNSHPFPSMVEIPEYPNASIRDIKRKVGGATNDGYETSWELETVKTMTIEEKIQFWKDVMLYAKDRGVEVSIFTWNIHVFGTETSGYGITDSISNTTTKNYMRKAVRSLINTYPLLAAIGVTAGENMGDNTPSETKEKWVWDTYGLGYKDAVDDAKNPNSPFYNPNRKVKFIHRAHQVNISAIMGEFDQLPGVNDTDSSLVFTYKYSQAHMHSSTKPLFINNWLQGVPAERKVILEVRNDDFYNIRWGDPDFARAYLNNFPAKVVGFQIGPDGFTWGREVVSKNPESPRQQTIDKQWYSFAIWGYLAYDPTYSNQKFQALLAARYPEVASDKLYAGLSSVSKVYPLITRFFWGSLDFRWYPEASMNYQGYVGFPPNAGKQSDDGFIGVQGFIDPLYSPMNDKEDGDPQLFMSVKDFVDNKPVNGRLTPPEVAAKLRQHAEAGALSVAGLNPGNNNDLRETIGDVKATAHLGLYYSEKILGAIDLYKYQKNNSDTASLISARNRMLNAANHWRAYAAQWGSQYKPQRLGRVGAIVDIAAMQASVDKDVPQPPNGTTCALTVNSGSGDGTYATGMMVNIVADAPPAGQVFDRWTGSTFGIANVLSPSTTLTIPANISSITVTATYKTSTFTQSVTILTLINADTDLDLGPLVNGAVLNLATLPTRNLNVRANTNPATVGSVRFALDGNANFSTESAAPYALAGNAGADYLPWTPAVGSHTLTATPYTAASGGSTAGTALSVAFAVIDSPEEDYSVDYFAVPGFGFLDNGDTIDLAVFPTGIEVLVSISPRDFAGNGGSVRFNLDDNANFSTDNTLHYTITGDTQWMPSLGNHTITATPYTQPNGGGVEGIARTVSFTVINSSGPAVVGLTLVNADNEQDIGPLTNGMTLNLDTLTTSNLNVRANTNPAKVGSVRFAYDGNSNFRIENTAVYALAGNIGANYLAWTPTNGSHTVTATAYSGSTATGTVGGAVTVTFSVIGSARNAVQDVPSGSSGDSDGDGLLDAYEKAVGLDPFNWDSDGNGVSDHEELDAATGLFGEDLQKLWLEADGNGGGGTPGTIGVLQIQKLLARVKLNKAAGDALAFKGSIPALDPSTLAGGISVNVSVGGETVSVTLDAKLRGKAANARSSVKVIKRVGGAGTYIDVKLNGGSWGMGLLGESSSQSESAIDVPIMISVDGKQYQAIVPTKYKGRAGVGGSLKIGAR